MSTKRKKLYTKQAEREARAELKSNSVRLVRKERRTKQIRIHIDWYKRVSAYSKDRKQTMSKTLDEVCKNFFGR